MLRSLMADLGNLPNEIMVKILSRVEPKSLARFKCVSKTWYALINDPKFCGFLQNQNVLLKRVVNNNETGKMENRFSFLKFPLAGDEDSSIDVEDVHFPCIFHEKYTYLDIHGHSQGLVCFFCHGPNHTFLYNPTTRELRKLPPSILLTDYNYTTLEGIYSIMNAIGFGYDPKSMDFKVVRVVDFAPSCEDLDFLLDLERPRYPSFDTFLPSRAEVYDLKKDKWREIKTPVPGRVFSMPSGEMYYQGLYYWWAVSKDVGRAEIILAFDMSEEIFIQIPVPKSFEKEDGNNRSLGVLYGSIVLFHYLDSWDERIERRERSFDVWKMEKLKGVISWSKLFTIGPLPEIIPTPLTFVDSDQLLMDTYAGKLILLNINTKHVKHLSLEGGQYQSTVFDKTLLSLNAMEHAMEDNIGEDEKQEEA